MMMMALRKSINLVIIRHKVGIQTPICCVDDRETYNNKFPMDRKNLLNLIPHKIVANILL